jgi:predicted small lipoprotein YifL
MLASLCLALLMMMLVACGQKGALYLVDQNGKPVRPAAQGSASVDAAAAAQPRAASAPAQQPSATSP